MHPVLAQLIKNVSLTGSIRADMVTLLVHHQHPQTVAHCLQVAGAAQELARQFGVDEQAAQIAGWLHDISAVFPPAVRLPVSAQFGLEILPEEALNPMLLHQKLSVEIAREIFGVQDPHTLNAIGHHTTLRPAASRLEQVVFVADKLRWDQAGDPPYLPALQAALNAGSLEHAALAYLEHLWQHREELAGPLHPWAAAAYHELKALS